MNDMSREEKRELVARMWEGGASQKEIARALGITPASVRHRLQSRYRQERTGDPVWIEVGAHSDLEYRRRITREPLAHGRPSDSQFTSIKRADCDMPEEGLWRGDVYSYTDVDRLRRLEPHALQCLMRWGHGKIKVLTVPVPGPRLVVSN